MGILDKLNPLKAIVGEVTKGIDALTTSGEEKMELRAKLIELNNSITETVLEYESTVANAQRDVIVAEAQSQSWMARNWRPILMLTITFILAHKYVLYPYFSKWFDLPDLLMPPELFTLLTVGVGGYIVGRSGEQVAKTLRGTRTEDALSAKDLKRLLKAEEQR